MGARNVEVNIPENDRIEAVQTSGQQPVELMALGEVSVELEKSRSKLRIGAILTGLYVSSIPLSPSLSKGTGAKLTNFNR